MWVEQDSVIIMELSDNTKLEQWLTKQCWREWTMDDGGIFHPHHNNFTTEVRISVPRTFAPSIFFIEPNMQLSLCSAFPLYCWTIIRSYFLLVLLHFVALSIH